MPNIEAYARVQLLRVEDGEVAACLQATLANGKTVRLKAVQIASGVFTLVALLIGLLHSTLDSPSPAQYRWLDVLLLFQTAAAAGMLHLNYPLVFSNFAQNFAWSFGLFHSTHMQNSINSMRNKTGGHMDGNAYSDVQYINRKLSPYNLLEASDPVDTNSFSSIGDFSSYISTLPTNDGASSSSGGSSDIVDDLIGLAKGLQKRGSIPSALYTNATEQVETGLPVYVNTLNIPEANAFTTIFFFFLAFIGIALVFHVLLFGIVLIANRQNHSTGWGGRMRRRWRYFAMGNALRVCLIWFLPIWIFGFYQWKIGDSGLAIFFAVFAVLLTLVPLAVAFVLSILYARRNRQAMVSPLYTSFRWYHSVGMIYRKYRPKFHFFWFIIVLAMIARSGFIAFGNNEAWAQVIGNLVVELIILVSLLALRPHKDRKGDWLSVVLSIGRLLIFGLLVAYIPSLEIKALIRAILGFVEIAIVGLCTVLLFFGMIWNAGYGLIWRKHRIRMEDGTEVEDHQFAGAGTGKGGADDDSQTRNMTQVDASKFIGGRSRAEDDSPHVSSVGEPLDVEYSPDSVGGVGRRPGSTYSGVTNTAGVGAGGAGAMSAYADAAAGRGQAYDPEKTWRGDGYGAGEGITRSGTRTHVEPISEKARYD